MTSEIGNRICSARRRAGYHSQREFARALGVSRGIVGQWESHSKKPGAANVLKIAQCCAVSMDYLLGKSTTMHEPIIASSEIEIGIILAYRHMTPIQQEKFGELLQAIVAFSEVFPSRSRSR